MSQAALTTYKSIIQQGTQQDVVNIMQTRNELYDVLGYHHYEEKLDQMKGEDNE